MSCLCGAHLAVDKPSNEAGPVRFDVTAIRRDFPILSRMSELGVPLAYLDSAATAHKPSLVLDAERDYYAFHNANVHRSHHTLAREATDLFNRSRTMVAQFIGAQPEEIVFTKNASEAFNLLAYAIGNASRAEPAFRSLAVGPGDSIVITEMEHHSNLMPWQELCRRTGARLRWLTITGDGRLDLSKLDETIDATTKLVAFTHQSNVYGTVNPVDIIVTRAREVGALTVLDACQSVPHLGVDTGRLGVDFLAFSGHKMCGPTGIGVLWGRHELLEALPPFLTGGEMNDTVTMEHSIYAAPPLRFEAGTPPIAQAVGLAAACRYLDRIGMKVIAGHEELLIARALDGMSQIAGLKIVGPADTSDRGAAISFGMAGHAPDELDAVLDRHGIAVRAGHLCARPACVRFGHPSVNRASFSFYTTNEEVDRLVDALRELASPSIQVAVPAKASVIAGVGSSPEFINKVLGDAATAVNGITVSIGDRLGLYRAMAGAGTLAPTELAERTGTHEIFVREWLHTQVGAGYVEYDAAKDRYTLPDAHAAVLADQKSPLFRAAFFPAIQALYEAEDRLCAGFRTGEGIGWHEYAPQMAAGIGRYFQPSYHASIVSQWLPAFDGMVERLTTGAKVADIGCGIGYSMMRMAEAFPRSTFHGYDYHEESISRGRTIAEDRGLADRVHFYTVAAENTAGANYDLVTFFNSLHDMGDPGGAARQVRKLLAPTGAWMIVEPNAPSSPADNLTEPGRLFLALSSVLCLPSAVAQKGPYALGNHAGEEAIRKIVIEAGFSFWRRASESPVSVVYEARP